MFHPRTLASVVDNVARKTIGKDWNLYAALLNHWPEIVGDEYARVTTPVKVSFPLGKTNGDKWAQGQRTDGVLHIRLPQGLAMEFTYLTEQIRQRISTCFGYNAIARIVFETFYSPQKTGSPVKTSRQKADREVPLPKEINDIDDDELRTALEGLGKAIY